MKEKIDDKEIMEEIGKVMSERNIGIELEWKEKKENVERRL